MWPSWTGGVQKRVCRYLLSRYVGQYLEEKLSLDQLTVDLYNGTGSVKNVTLDCSALNGVAEQHSLPFELIEGHVETISVSVPWSTIMTDSCEIEITGMQITIQPKQRGESGNSMFDSMFTSMASSMQLAEECLKINDEVDDEQEEFSSQEPLSGLEHCAQTIDAVLSRVKLCFRDTIVRVEKCQKGDDVGVALEFHIKLWRYSDENFQDTNNDPSQAYDSAFSHKKIVLEGLTCYSDIFSSKLFGHQEENSNDQKDEPDNSVLIGKFAGRHEVRIQVKTDDSMSGPQVSVECHFGSLIAYLSPIQAHIVYKIVDELMNPVMSDDGGNRKFCKEKPMDSFDFKRVEEELQEQLKPGVIGFPGLIQQQGWSTGGFNDDSDDEFLPLKSKTKMYHSSTSNVMINSMSSMMSSMQQSVTDSLVSSTVKSSHYNYHGSSGLSTMQACEKTKFVVTFASISVALLHDDLLVLSSTEAVVSSSVKDMRESSRRFFQGLSLFGVTVKGQKDVSDVREKLNSACDRSHHRLIAAPVKIEGLIKGTISDTETIGQLVLGYCELVESLKYKTAMSSTPNPECIEVLTFPKNFEHGSSQSLKMEFKSKSCKTRLNSFSKTYLKFCLQECHCEFDVSVIDRIYSVFNSPLQFTKSKILSPPQQKTHAMIKVSVKCPVFSLNFRFPIPDMRPKDDVNRTSHWIRNLRHDSVVAQLQEFNFSTMLNSASDVTELITKCHEIRLFYKESPLKTPILFATALADDPDVDSASMRSQGLDWPRIVVLLSPERSTDITGETEGSDEGEGMDSFFSGKPKGTSPFSSRTVIHENLHGDNTSASASVIPGNRAEMNDFIEATTKNVLFKIDISLRFLDVSFPSKHFFEEIYNRFGNDLLLWEPSRQKTPAELSFASTQVKLMPTPFSMCKSAIKLDPGSDSEDELNTFYTPAGCGSIRFDNKSKKKSLGYGQSEVTVCLSVSKGTGSFFTPVQDTSGNIIPGQNGQLMITLQDACLFVVSSYKSDPLLGFMCLSSHKAEMQHSDLVRSVEMFPNLSSDLLKTIFPSDRCVLPKKDLETNESDSDMLSVAIRIERDSVTNIKTFKVATGIREGTLDHRMYSANRSWFTQLTDFFDVTDTPIIGYIPSTVLTELHLHLWDCAIDYRPLNLPMRSILTMDTFSISSNIAAQTSTSVIRFICEDSALFLTTKFDSNDLSNDYVCVMEMDYFDLSLRLCTNRSSTAPRIDLSASSNVLHIRTCSDSFKALVELLTYYSFEGDLVDPNQSTSSKGQELGQSAPFPCMKEASSEPALITTEETQERDRRMSVSTTEYVHDMVAEAIEDQDSRERLPKSSSSQSFNDIGSAARKPPKASYEIHFTPSADFNFNSEPCKDDSRGTTPLPLHGDPIFESANGLPVELQLSDEDEEKFCILEDDPGVGILPKHGEPEARVLVAEPIRLIENYFSPPAGKLDILKAPKHYPNPAMKYSLKEMTIVWHLYGGSDFGVAPCRKSSAKSEEQGSSEMLFTNDSWKDQTYGYGEQSDQIDIAIDVLNPGVMFSKTKAFESAWEAYEGSPKTSNKFTDSSHSWRQQGGKGRKHEILVELNLSKIKLIHEVYPESAEQASRQVIVINNIEIIDRLLTSQYNKMMYLYTSPNRPKQTNANMVVIKAAHVRPDPHLPMEECSLKISILPIRLNIDQDTILFLYTFFSDLSSKSGSEDGDSFNGRLTNPPSHTPSVESLPIMTVNFSESEGSSHNDGEDGSNLLMFSEETFGADDNVSTCSKDPSIDSTKPPAPVYFRQVIFSPEVPIRLDYRGKRVDMTHGPLAGLLMGLGQLNCSEITLKRISHRHGILGFDRLAAFIINDWATDIKKNQLPSLLGGVGPMHSFVQLFQGVRDLFWLPIEQYQKDGRIAKGLQRGVNSFSASTAMAALELTNKIIQTVQGAAEFTYDMVSPGPSVQQKRRQSSSKRKKKYTQPSDIREGMTNAYNVVKEGLGDTAHTIVKVASKEHEQKGISGAVGGVLRQIPPTVVRPIILVAEATSNVLDGFRSQIEPEFKKQNEEKWKET